MKNTINILFAWLFLSISMSAQALHEPYVIADYNGFITYNDNFTVDAVIHIEGQTYDLSGDPFEISSDWAFNLDYGTITLVGELSGIGTINIQEDLTDLSISIIEWQVSHADDEEGISQIPLHFTITGNLSPTTSIVATTVPLPASLFLFISGLSPLLMSRLRMAITRQAKGTA